MKLLLGLHLHPFRLAVAVGRATVPPSPPRPPRKARPRVIARMDDGCEVIDMGAERARRVA